MSYENPRIPEGINVSKVHPLKDFFSMLIGVGLVSLLLITALMLLTDRLVRFIPFSAEQAWWAPPLDESLDPPQRAIQSYLQSLANELAVDMALPEAMPITIHYRPEPVINAFATLGGHVTVYQGLLQKLDNENALAMLLAHEIAHIQHRDPVVALGRGLALGLVVATLAGVGDEVITDRLLSQISDLSQLSFNRSQERAADAAALQAVYQRYGHVNGVAQLFETLQASAPDQLAVPLFQTHPLSKERLRNLHRFANDHASQARPAALEIPLHGDGQTQRR